MLNKKLHIPGCNSECACSQKIFEYMYIVFLANHTLTQQQDCLDLYCGVAQCSLVAKKKKTLAYLT